MSEPVQLRGAAAALWHCRDAEVLMDGPAGTGKTRAILERMHYHAETYPGYRGLAVRQTRKSMTDSVLVTFEQDVLPLRHPARKGAQRVNRHSYIYPNGSEIVLGGMDHPERFMSTQYDEICAFEATEISQDAWEKLSTRLRNGRMPYQQGVCDCNPAAPSHWLNRRCIDRRMTRLISRHVDNPRWYDANGNLNEDGRTYIERLQRLQGVRRLRLLEGKWAASEGIVFPEFDRAVHLINEAPPCKWYVAGVDWGFRDPGVITLFGVDGDKAMYRVAEIYMTGKTIDWWTDRAIELANEYPAIKAWACDPSRPEHIHAFRKKGLNAIKGNNAIEKGIDAIRSRLVRQGDGRAGLYWVRDASRFADEDLVADHQPLCSEEEIESYMYPQAEDGKPKREIPTDLYNHGMDSVRYAAMYVDNQTISRGRYRNLAV